MIMLKLADELKSNTGLTITRQHQQERESRFVEMEIEGESETSKVTD